MRLLMLSGDRQVSVGEKGPFYSLQREFSKYFERIDVLCPQPRRPVSVQTIFERVHLHPSPVSRARLARWLARRGEELIGEHGARLIVSHDYGWFYNGTAAARIAARTGVPYLSEIHHVPGFPVAESWRERFERRIARRYVRWAIPRAKAFRVVNANEMPALLESWGVPREQIAVIPSLYIDLEVFRPAAPAPEPEQDVCFVGRLVENKGLLRLVDALGTLDERGRPCRALFVGKGPLRKALEERLKKRKLAARARFVEWVESPAELAEIYRRSRLVVCASTCEGGPRFTVEALACGTPVVSTPVGVMSELLADGACGKLVGFDRASLADGIQELLADEPRRRAAGAAGQARVQRYEYAAAIRFYAEELQRLAGETGA
jgi:glycosyltransferase involved in cell wall biosynthesis